MSSNRARYRSPDEDSARWDEFRFRPGDIVISARSKSGTTWMQMICALLVFRTPRLPARMAYLSPWLDWLVEPLDEVIARLEAQQHRRFVKTHTPLDGLPLDQRATYIVLGRHPLDMAVSLYHQGANLGRKRIAELTGNPQQAQPERPPVADWLREWIGAEPEPGEALDSLPGIMWHVGDAWERRAEPNVVLVHYADLLADLPGEMRRLADRLAIDLVDEEPAALAAAATFDAMRERSGELSPDPAGVLVSQAAFFRRGSSGAGAELLTPEDLARYEQRARSLAPPDLLAWLHR